MDALLSAIEHAPKPKPREQRHYSWEEYEALDGRGMRSLYVNPVGIALRHGVKELGERLWEITGSTDEMRKSLDRVAELNPKTYGRRMSLMNAWWDGAGGKWHA